MPPSLQTLPNELKQKIAFELILPDPSPADPAPVLINRQIDTSHILAFRLTNRDIRDNAAIAFEEVISELCVGCSESSLDRVTKISEDPYFSKHIKRLCVSTRIYRGEATLLGPTNGSDQIHFNFGESERLMLASGQLMLKICNALQALPNCRTVVLSGSQLSSEVIAMRTSLTGNFAQQCRYHFDIGRVLYDLTSAIIVSGISLSEFNVMLDERGSMPIAAFVLCMPRLAQLQKAFSNLTSLKLQVECWNRASQNPDPSHFVTFVNSFPSVTTLELSLRDPGIGLDLPEDYLYSDLILRQIYLPNLRALVLAGMVTDGLFVEKFLLDHSASLRTLHIRNVGFTSSLACVTLFRALVGTTRLQELEVEAIWSCDDMTFDRNMLKSFTIRAQDGKIDCALNQALKAVI
ncbi:hypothetical protein FKW77_005045 [Venturia effusa]|uniref:F-box domain-containing protein n=1 Tax=Venturia effusa TaxID=50376 RepID=A0A517LKD0_9PEZI|nr:hypothetical protein FKW77_005045 [Venturia effusa]